MPDEASRAFPSRPHRRETKKKSRLGLVIWMVALLALAAVAYWAYLEANRSGGNVGTIPPAPEPIRGIGDPVAVETPQEPDVLNGVLLNADGYRQYEAGHYDSALVSFRLAVQVDPDHADYRRNLALALLRVEQPEEALQHLQRALRLDPTLEIAQYDYARALLMSGDTAQALEEFGIFADRVATSTDARLAAAYLAAQNAVSRIRQAQAQAEAAAAAERNGAQPALPVPDTIAPVIPADQDD